MKKLRWACILGVVFTAPFNNMRTLKFKAKPTNAFFATINQMFDGSSQLLTTAEHCFVFWTVLNDLITAHSAVVGRWEKLLDIWLTEAKNAFVNWILNFGVRMLLKDAVKTGKTNTLWYFYWLEKNVIYNQSAEDTKLRQVLFRLLHRRTATIKELFKFQLVEDKKCIHLQSDSKIMLL